jgi:hypothetical protein
MVVSDGFLSRDSAQFVKTLRIGGQRTQKQGIRRGKVNDIPPPVDEVTQIRRQCRRDVSKAPDGAPGPPSRRIGDKGVN